LADVRALPVSERKKKGRKVAWWAAVAVRTGPAS
jgi:hypothetical protein